MALPPMVRVVADSEVLAPTVRVLEQASAPVELVKVQPVLPLPPPSRMSPVLIPPIPMVFAPLASTVSAPVPDIAVPDTFSELTALAVRVPPETVPPLNVPAEIVAPFIVPVQAKLPEALVKVQPVLPDPPPSRMSPVLVLPMLTAPLPLPSRLRAVLVPPAATARAPVPVMAVPDTLRLFTAAAVSVPPDTLPPLNVPAEIVAPFMVPVQAKLPEALVTVQPVEPDPPPRRMSPVDVPPINTWPLVEPSRLMFWAVLPAAMVKAPVPLIAVPLTLRLFTAAAVRVPPEIVPPLMVAPLIVLAAVTTPAAVTLNLVVGEEPLCRSIRLPVGEALVLLAKMTAWPAVGLPAVVAIRVELVLVPLSSLRTPEAMAELELVKVSRLLAAVTAALDVSVAFLAM